MMYHYHWQCYSQVVLASLCRFSFYLFIIAASCWIHWIGCYFNKISGELFNDDACWEESQKAIYYQVDTRWVGKSPEFNKKLQHGKRSLAYACATLWKHNENKIRGKVIMTGDSDRISVDIREVIRSSSELVVGWLDKFLALFQHKQHLSSMLEKLQLQCIFS